MISGLFRHKTVLVTGHTGFKGSWLTLWLHTLGADVNGYSLSPDTKPSHYLAAGIPEILSSECLADIRDKKTLTGYISRIRPDCIFHLAAQPLVRRSYAEPVDTFDVNVMGSIHLMEAVRQNPCPVIMITSDKCYRNISQIWGYRECDPLGGYDPYSASKAAAEIAIDSYRNSYNLPLASVRAGNVIGGGDWAEDRIIPDAVRAVIAGKPLELRSPGAVRPWQHVLEPLSGYLLLAAKMLAGEEHLNEPWNFGPLPTGAATVRDIVSDFYHIWGEGGTVYDPDTDHPHEAHMLRLSSEKAMTLLGWKPVWDLGETIAVTANWYKNYYAGADARTLSLSDISAYEKRVSWGN
jgi:CDP-glucose 4,6-dehydratase